MGSSSSTASSNSTVDNTFNNIDNRVGSDGGSIGGNVNLNASGSDVGNVSITSSDYGAIEGGLSVALAALEAGNENFEQSLDFVGEANDKTNASLSTVLEASKSETAAALQDFMKWSAVVLLGGGTLYLAFKKFTK